MSLRETFNKDILNEHITTADDIQSITFRQDPKVIEIQPCHVGCEESKVACALKGKVCDRHVGRRLESNKLVTPSYVKNLEKVERQ